MNERNQYHTAWAKDSETVFSELQTTTNGLSSEEAIARLKRDGANIVGQRKSNSILKLLWNQCKNPFVILLVVAALFSFFLGKLHEGFFVIGAIVVNIVLGFWQEYKADNAVKKLENYITQRARTTRDGTQKPVDAKDIVIGDYIYFQSGDRVPADVRIIQSDHLEVDESILTGESLPVSKNSETIAETVSLAERTNMLWGGTVITDGTAEGVVIATGDATEIGALATLVGKQKTGQTPLEKSVTQFTKIISIALVLVGIIIAIIGVNNGYETQEVLLLSIAVIVSAVPESLPIALSVVLAMGAEVLAKKKAVVRKMTATETLGTTSLILTDKTGTLTEGKLTLVAIDAPETEKDTLLVDAVLNTDVAKEGTELLGRPLDIALVQTVDARPELQSIQLSRTVIERLAFNSVNKFTAVLYEKDSVRYIAALGAPDILLEKTTLSEKEKLETQNYIDTASQSGERVLGVIKATVDSKLPIAEALKTASFAFSGLIRFRDPIRQSVPAAVEKIKGAGVRTVIVTGDHPGTAMWVGREIGLEVTEETVLTGAQLRELSDEELTAKLGTITIFARVTPEQKIRLVELYEKQGEVVAVTGDGVNDAPALKAATIGVAMGSGTDVARASADIVILDNNYDSIVDAIFEGRGVLKKIRTVIAYLMADSFDELLLVGGSILMAVALPLNALQILFVKFFSDIFPTMAFTFEKIESKSVAKLNRNARLLDKSIMIFTFGRGIVSSALLFILYLFLLNQGHQEELVRTFIYGSFSSYLLFLAFSMRNLEESIFSYNPLSNKWLNIGVLAGFVMIVLSIYWRWLGDILGTIPLPTNWFLGIIGIGFINFLLVEVFKFFLKPKPKNEKGSVVAQQ